MAPQLRVEHFTGILLNGWAIRREFNHTPENLSAALFTELSSGG